MNKTSRTLPWLVLVGVVLIILMILLAYLSSPARSGSDLPVLGKIEDFQLTNQFGRLITLADLRGQIWVADIIFTRCPGPCPQLTQRMRLLQEALSDRTVKLVSLTTDPEFDTPAVLKRYAERFGAEANRWLFLTGPKEEIRRLAVQGLKLSAEETDPASRTSPQDLFIHATYFVVVDQQGRLRQVVQGLEPDFKKRVLAATKRLLND